MRLKTVFDGEIEVPDSRIITFVSPLVGFDHLARFVIYQRDHGPLFWLQSVDDCEIAFCVVAPFAAGIDPEMSIDPDDAAAIRSPGEGDIDVYTLVVLDRDLDKVRTNLRAPILVGRQSNLATQVILDDPELPICYPLKAVLTAAEQG
ncbi:MAG: flagellar assembly protein FliW [Planctomycetota bacterium]